MVIVLTGGGSGGHITPILAVAAELKQLQPDATLIYIGQTGDKLAAIPAGHPAIDAVYGVRAGKFRRYHSEGLKQLLDIKTLLLNTRDFAYVAIGLLQSRRLLKRLKPDVIFIKGGFVGVPVGLSAAQLRIPFVTHDSDVIPGLANRIIARWANVHAVGQPKELYAYTPNKTVTVGVPVQPEFIRVSAALQARYREELALVNKGPVITVAGGGLGAHTVNQALLKISAELFGAIPGLTIIHQVGQIHEANMNSAYDAALPANLRSHVLVKGYVTDMYRLSGAADIIVSRAGATNIAEFAVQAKACIIIANPYLTAGHQLKNADALAAAQAVLSLSDPEINRQPSTLRDAIIDLLRNTAQRQQLAENLHALAFPDAAHRLAMVLLEQVTNTNSHVEPKIKATTRR